MTLLTKKFWRQQGLREADSRREKVANWVLERTKARSQIIRRYERIGLIIFVAIPLPFTGAWTGAITAFLIRNEISPCFSGYTMRIDNRWRCCYQSMSPGMDWRCNCRSGILRPCHTQLVENIVPKFIKKMECLKQLNLILNYGKKVPSL